MKKETAEKLLALLQAIDTDHPKDWVDLVCTARESLPKSTEAELRAVLDDATPDAKRKSVGE